MGGEGRVECENIGYSRNSAKSDPSQNSQLGVCNKFHGSVVVALDPELDLGADVLEHDRGRSSLTSRCWWLGTGISSSFENTSPRLAWYSLRPYHGGLVHCKRDRISGRDGNADSRDKFGDDVGSQESKRVEKGEGREWNNGHCH